MQWTTQAHGWHERLWVMSSVLMGCTTQGSMSHKHKALDVMNDFGSWAQGCGCYEYLRAINDMNIFWFLALGYKFNEQVSVVDYTNKSRAWAHGCRCYEQLKAMVDMFDSTSHELRALDVMNSSRLWMIWITLGCGLMALDALNNSWL